jgi:hypothetical protein
MIGGQRFHRARVVPLHALNFLPVLQVRAHYLRHIARLQFAIPRALRIHHHHRSFVAQAHAAAGRHLDFVVESFRLYRLSQRVK